MKRKISKFILSVCAVSAIVIALSGNGKAHAQASDPFIGQLAYVAFNFAPRLWTTCDGQLLSIGQNTALFSLLGTSFGGDGRTNFKLPDMRGRVPIHMGAGPGLSTYILGRSGGFETIVLSIAHLPTHKHLATAQSQSTSVSTASGGGGGGTVNGELWGTNQTANAKSAGSNTLASGASLSEKWYRSGTTPDVQMATGSVKLDLSSISIGDITTTTTTDTVVSVQDNGGGQGFPVVQPYVVLNCIISLDGIFPARN